MMVRQFSTNRGFSLLEAIVALLLVTMLSMTSFSWISNLLLSVEKIEKNTFN
jgi:prepilin-type N-terminal cleavage/methylation domain-containing protein